MAQCRQRRSPTSAAGTLIVLPILAALLLLLSPACGNDLEIWPGNRTFRSALNGNQCAPNVETFMPDNGSNGNVSPTGIPGDNMDDLRSGKVDCLGDGNSGQGDDKKHNCTFPQPGCDDVGCCEVPPEDEVSDPPADDEAPPPDCSELDDICGNGYFDEESGECQYLEWPECESA